MKIWATRWQGGGADLAVWRETVCYLLGNTWRAWDYLDYQARVFKTLVFGLIPRSCSTLPLPPFHLATVWLELDLQFELQSLLIPYICCFAFSPSVDLTWWRYIGTCRTSLRDFTVYFRRALALLDGAISGPVVLLSRFHRLLTGKLSGLSDLSVASICGPRVSRVCGFRTSPMWKIPGHFPGGPSRVPSRQRSSFCPGTAPSCEVR